MPPLHKKPKSDYVQHPPFCIQIELTEGCNLRCTFCGLNGIRGKENNFKFLSVSLASRIAKLIRKDRWTSRIEFAMHGEPSVNPDLVEILRVFRRRLPNHHLMMTSNGAGFLRETTKTVDECLRYLNVLALDDYEGVSIVTKVMRSYNGKHKPVYYPSSKHGNPHRRRKLSEHDLVVVQDIEQATQGTHSSLNNHCGCGSPKNDSAMGKRCAKPFREMSIRWDGFVALCCNDWRGYYKCGHVEDKTLEQIWQSAEFMAARRRLILGKRDFGPCEGCDALSYRPGLLPDQRGKVHLPEPSRADEETIAKALFGASYTLPVLREWESA